MADKFFLSKSALEKIRKTIQKVDGLPVQPKNNRPRPPNLISPQMEVVEVTSLDTTDGRYPAKLLLYDSENGTYETVNDSIWAVPLKVGETLGLQRYLARRVGDVADVACFLCTCICMSCCGHYEASSMGVCGDTTDVENGYIDLVELAIPRGTTLSGTGKIALTVASGQNAGTTYYSGFYFSIRGNCDASCHSILTIWDEYTRGMDWSTPFEFTSEITGAETPLTFRVNLPGLTRENPVDVLPPAIMCDAFDCGEELVYTHDVDGVGPVFNWSICLDVTSCASQDCVLVECEDDTTSVVPQFLYIEVWEGQCIGC